MPHYVGSAEYQHGTAARLGILLCNLGTPDAPTAAAVRRFLAEFLGDPRVIEQPRWLWWLALHGVILRIRPRRSAHAYRQIWTDAGSPLMVYTQQLVAKIRASLGAQMNPQVHVALGMTYGNPAIAAALSGLQQANVERLLVLPLFPQYSATSTAPVFDRVSQALARWRRLPEVRFVMQYHDDPRYIAALAADVAAHWRVNGRKHLLFSFHGIPKRYVLCGDPYHCQCLKTARLVAEQLQLAPGEWTAGFQSRFGREEWIGPYTDEILRRLGQSGPKQLSVLCPGFAADCLETLEENALRNRELFLSSGGEIFDYIPALNATDSHVEVLCSLIRRHCQGWPETEPQDATPSITDLENSKARALALGAAR